MTEADSLSSDPEDPKRLELSRYIAIAKELSGIHEVLPFPGISDETLEGLRKVDRDWPGQVTPVDELIVIMKNKGIKIVLGEDSESGNVLVVPFGCKDEDVVENSLFPRHLEDADKTDPRLGELTRIGKARHASASKQE